MIEADRGGDHGIAGGEDPSHDRDKMHAIEHHAISDGKPLMLTDICDGCG